MKPTLLVSNPAGTINLKNVSVHYRSYRERPSSLKESIIRIVRERKMPQHSIFQALSDVSFTVGRGEIVGIIGGNGSGKSTLLKVIAGVLHPTLGAVERRGSVASLIELGAGFDPELTAVENIYLHGSLHRKSRSEIRSRIAPILEFAELADFAHTPVKYFSSGMYARLGFSVAADIDPEILLVDEILSVGDERFQLKSAEVFQRFIERKKTIVMVSHDLPMIERVCHRGVLLANGKIVYTGTPQEAVAQYRGVQYQHSLSS